MERNLVLPLAIATAVHVGLLFGSHRGPVPHVTQVVPNILLKPFENLKVEEPPPEETTDSTADRAPKEQIVPRSVDRPAVPQPDQFEMKMVPQVDVDTPLKDLKGASFATTIGDIARNTVIWGSNLDNNPRTRTQIPPAYPNEARRDGLTGRVIVEFTVDEQGRVIDPRVVNSTNRVFEDATLHAISRWRFEPGRKDGRVVRFRMSVPVEFNLND